MPIKSSQYPDKSPADLTLEERLREFSYASLEPALPTDKDFTERLKKRNAQVPDPKLKWQIKRLSTALDNKFEAIKVLNYFKQNLSALLMFSLDEELGGILHQADANCFDRVLAVLNDIHGGKTLSEETMKTLKSDIDEIPHLFDKILSRADEAIANKRETIGFWMEKGPDGTKQLMKDLAETYSPEQHDAIKERLKKLQKSGRFDLEKVMGLDEEDVKYIVNDYKGEVWPRDHEEAISHLNDSIQLIEFIKIAVGILKNDWESIVLCENKSPRLKPPPSSPPQR